MCDAKKILTAEDVYILINKQLGVNRIRNYMKEGKIPSQKVGKAFVAERNDVINFFQNYFLQTQN